MHEQPVRTNRPRGIVVVATLMILFGLAEVVTAFTHHFLGLVTARMMAAIYMGAPLGILYAAAGLLILMMKRWAAAVAMVFLVVVIIGRIFMVVTGMYPMGSSPQRFGMIVGTLIVAYFISYLRSKRYSFT
jgi:hypothetical protein